MLDSRYNCFQRSKAILRNSMYYFSRAADVLLRDPSIGTSPAIGHFVRDLLGVGQVPGQDKTIRLNFELVRLEKLAFSILGRC